MPTPDKTSLPTSDQKLSTFEKWPRMTHPTALLLYISRTVWDRIIKFYKLTITTLGRKLPRKHRQNLPGHMASGGISREKFKQGYLNFTRLLRTTGSTTRSDMTSLVACGRLQNAIKYSTKVLRKTGSDGQSQIILPLFNHTHQMLYWHPGWPDVQQHWIWHHELLPIGIYRSSKSDRKYSRLWIEF